MAKGIKTGGRQPGSPNKVTREFRETVLAILHDNSENAGKWLTAVADGDEDLGVKADPGRALDLMSKLAEYATPKLARTEHTGEGGGPVRIVATNQDEAL
jgi:hypothetical protein